MEDIKQDSKVTQKPNSQNIKWPTKTPLQSSSNDSQAIERILKSFFEIAEEGTANDIDDTIHQAIVIIVSVNEHSSHDVSNLLRLQKLIRTVSDQLYPPHRN